ncbi:MAG TPA: FlgD immunoglobulin-like domain containing protein, partial [Bacteroidia bacterium]|nr:FlgD immunoglobulin-like domain containing protein [Bacteroidia bacterium]
TGIREIYTSTILQNWSMYIPANTIKTFTAQYPKSGGLPIAVSLYATFPHQHKVGVSIVNYAYSGIDTIPLVRINNWNFSWQGYYTYPMLVKVPVGYTIFSSHVYDNTTGNPNNPFSPPQNITAGTSTTNEMLFDSYQYLIYQPGDDTINITNLLSGDTLLAVQQHTAPTLTTKAYPNPFDKQVHIGFTLSAASNNITIVIYNIYGAKVKTLVNNQRVMSSGYYESIWDGTNDSGAPLPSGVYIYSITANRLSTSGRLIITR